MELKNYQQTVIADLENYLEYLGKFAGLYSAFREYWRDKGLNDLYKDNVKGSPHVCIKVPTAGGKTFIAVNALRPIYEHFSAINQTLNKVVVWLVPSRTILDQTVKNLANPQHPYRIKLNSQFNGRVEIFEKKDILQGVGFSPDAVREQLSVVILSFDSLRAKNKEDRKLYQDNGNLADFEVDDENISVMTVLRSLKPVVIVDESHNAETDLSVEMLQNLSPSFILDLTATPRNNSNIISYVNAAELKRNKMVKLPVIVQNQKDKESVINHALDYRRKLEQIAVEEEKTGGSYIRPILLFQAEPKKGEEAVTFNKIKESLIESGIPPAEIKIKTAEINELKDVDLMSRECPVRYIITINALKEGWDCPFAYVLASLANKASAVDVEQLLGRILRQPHVRQHDNDLLNMCYVFTASNMFRQTLDNIVKALNQAGFSKKDFRAIEAVAEVTEIIAPPKQNKLFEDEEPIAKSASDGFGEIDVSKINPIGESSIENVAPNLENLIQTALETNKIYEAEIDENKFVFPVELEGKTQMQRIKEFFVEAAQQLKLPQFFLKVHGKGGFFDADETLEFFANENILEGFRLSQQSTEINFETVDTQVYKVDIENIRQDDYKPEYHKLDAGKVEKIRNYFQSLPPHGKVSYIKNRFGVLIGNMYPIADTEVKEYVGRIVGQMTEEQIEDCFEREHSYSAKIRQQIRELSEHWKEREFAKFLDTDKIVVRPNYELPEAITLAEINATGIAKSLYESEGKLNNFEWRAINDLANLENIKFWHRIIERRGFGINGFVNHYPDFLIVTKKGKIILLETKGDDRDNSDSERKLKLGKMWQAKAGNDFLYIMVFDNNPIDGAYKLADAVKLIREM